MRAPKKYPGKINRCEKVFGPLLTPPWPPSLDAYLGKSPEEITRSIEINSRRYLPRDEDELHLAIFDLLKNTVFPNFTPIEHLHRYLPRWLHYPPRVHKRGWVRVVAALQRNGESWAYLTRYKSLVVCPTRQHDESFGNDTVELTLQELDDFQGAKDFETWRAGVFRRQYAERNQPIW